MYPVMLNVHSRPCLVVGGGGVALRKAEGLVEEGARVTVVATEVTEGLARLARDGKLVVEHRAYREGEAADYALVFAATDDRTTNRQVFEDGDRAGVWVNVADDPEICSYHLPSRIRRGTLQLAVASAGEAPFVVRRMRQLLEKKFGPEWGEWVEAAARFRKTVRKRGVAGADAERLFDRFFRETVDAERLRARVPTASEERAWLEQQPAKPRQQEDKPCQQIEKTRGFVSLVGAGPGDAGLLSVRGHQRLMAADAVVYDRLAQTAIPTMLPASVELHPVGKRAGHHPVPQEEINALLVRLGRAGKRVVRLKGGDPYVFGRGGEEAEALVAAGVPFEVVPAVTAGVAVPAYAGIPVTHRREVVRVTMVTAHESVKEDGPQVRWDLLAGDPHATLLGYMGVTSFPGVAEKLLEAGLDSDTPAAMIRRGTTSQQKTVRATVSTLAQAIEDAKLRPPALFVIGPAVRHADNLAWYDQRPLFGQRLVAVAPAGELGEILELQGAEVVEVPLPVTPAARAVMEALPVTGCVLCTPDQAEALDEERDTRSFGPDVVAWCLDETTARRARELGWTRVEQTAPADLPAAIR